MMTLPTTTSPSVKPIQHLRYRYALVPLALLTCFFVPLFFWCYQGQMHEWRSLEFPWPSRSIIIFTVFTSCLLLIFPIWWVIRGRVLDPVGLFLAQQAFQLLGYFFLGTTAYNIPNAGNGILATSGLIIIINALGTVVLLTVLEFNYFLSRHTRFTLAPLPKNWAVIDEKALIVLRVFSLACAIAIATPMVLTKTIPALSGNVTLDRYVMVSSDVGRALYHAGSGLLPFIVGGLTLGILKKPQRIFGVDGIAIITVCTLQLLTANRLPLAFAIIATVCLVSLQFKWPRWILIMAFCFYIFCFVFLGGLMAALRNDSDKFLNSNWFVASFEEAYLGNTLIDVRDGSWVFSKWDFEPLFGKTYLGGALSFVPSGLFPQKKDWHLGLTNIRTVGWPDDSHFGTRNSMFGEAFFNFGFLGVVYLASVLGILFAFLLRLLHLAAQEKEACLLRNLTYLLLIQMLFPLTNSSDAFLSWVFMAALLILTFSSRILAR